MPQKSNPLCPPGISTQDWGRIYAKAWLDDGFKYLLQTDPTAALKQFEKEHGLEAEVFVQVQDAPRNVTDEQLEKILAGEDDSHCFPPACC